MPPLETVLAFVLASTVVVVVPGPNVVYIVARGVTQGRAAAVASTFGVEVGMLVHIAAAATGLSAIVTRTALTFTAVKVAGAAYLLVLAVRALRGVAAPTLQQEPLSRARSAGRLFRQGFLVSALNPKVAVFFLAFLPQFVGPAAAGVPTQTLVLGLVFLVLATVSDLGYAWVSGTAGRRAVGALRRARRWRYAEAGVYAGLGVAVAVSGVDDA